MISTRIVLMRHGQCVQSQPRRFVGQRDLPLDETGLAQAAWVRDWLADIPFTRAACSDLCRASETARIVLGDRPLTLEGTPLLREIRLGAWEGSTHEEVSAQFPGEYERRGQDLAGYRPLGGESFQDLLDRVWPVFETIATQPGPSLVVAHAGVNRVILSRLLGLPLAKLFGLAQNYAGVNVIRRVPGGYAVEVVNAAARASNVFHHSSAV